MKKTSITFLALAAILAFLLSPLPTNTVLAMKPDTDITLRVRNRTNGRVSLLLIEENGEHLYFEYQPGLTDTALSEGLYQYYASTPCGNRSGEFNLNVTKQLFFSCDDSLAVELTVPMNNRGPLVCYQVFDFTFSESVYPYFQWGSIGVHCQNHPAEQGDTIRFHNPFWNDTPTYYYEPQGIECFQAGNGYYYEPCPG